MKRAKCILSALLCGWLGASSALPCTTFVLQGDGHIYFGRNFDWFSEDGLVIINQRNIRKTAFVTPGNTPAQWTSRYGSVTFNAVGQEMPCGGMNEAGLVIEDMWLDQTRCPAADSRPAVNALEWIQYQLDNCRTVAEVVASDERLRIDPLTIPARVHYLVCDAGGDCASIEFLDGKMVCHRGENLPCRALANDPYDASAAYLKAHPEPQGSVRAVRAAYRMGLMASAAGKFPLEPPCVCSKAKPLMNAARRRSSRWMSPRTMFQCNVWARRASTAGSAGP
jgi:penicillin V acylase-like amidase (Ntn superfamily)